MKKNKFSFFRHFATISLGTVINVVIGLLTVPLITRLVNPTEYGELSIFTLYAEIAIMVLCVGLDQALVRYYYVKDNLDYKRELLRRCWRIPVFLSVCVAIIFILGLTTGIIKSEFTIEISLILVIYVFCQIFNRFSFLVMRLEYDSKLYASLHVLHKVSYAVLVVLCLFFIKGHDLLILVLCTLISIAVVTIVGIISEKKIWFGIINVKQDINTRELIRYGAPFILSTGVVTVFQGIDKIALNYFCGSEEVGIYSGALNLIKIFTIVQTSFNSLWAPMAMENYEKNHEDRSMYQNACNYVSIAMFFIGLTLIAGKDLFILFLGSQYRQAAYVLPCLIFYPIMYTISEVTCVGIDFVKKSYLHIWVAVGACVTNIIGNVLLVPILKGQGAAISTGLSYIMFFTLRTFLSNMNFKVDFKVYRIYLISAIIFLYAIYNTFNSFSEITLIGYWVCILLIYILYHREFKDGFILIKKIIDKKRGT